MKSWLIGKDSDAGRDWGQEEKGTTEDEMAGWHHWLDGRESEWTPGVGDGQGGLACCDSWGPKESDTTERLNWTELNHSSPHITGQEINMRILPAVECLFQLCIHWDPLWDGSEIKFHWSADHNNPVLWMVNCSDDLRPHKLVFFETYGLIVHKFWFNYPVTSHWFLWDGQGETGYIILVVYWYPSPRGPGLFFIQGILGM